MASSNPVEISEELLAAWSMSCVHMEHLLALIQRELQVSGQHAQIIDLAEQIRRAAADLHRELRQHGARNSNAKIAKPQLIRVQEVTATRWAESGIQMDNLATFIGKGLPRSKEFARAIDLTVIRRAGTICHARTPDGGKPHERSSPTSDP